MTNSETTPVWSILGVKYKAHKVIELSQKDYEMSFGHLDQMVGEALGTN